MHQLPSGKSDDHPHRGFERAAWNKAEYTERQETLAGSAKEAIQGTISALIRECRASAMISARMVLLVCRKHDSEGGSLVSGI